MNGGKILLRQRNLLILLVSLIFLTVLIPTVCAADNETILLSDDNLDEAPISISNNEEDVLKTVDFDKSVESEDNSNGTFKEDSLALFEDEIAYDVGNAETNIDITVPKNVKEGESADIIVEIVNATGNVSVFVDGRENTVALVNGNAVVSLVNLAAGNHSVVAVYDGDDLHAPAHTISSFSVAANVDIKPAASKFVNITVINDSNISAVLMDENGMAIANAPVTYSVDGKSASVVTDSNGKFMVDVGNGAVAVISYAGNADHLASNITIKFNNAAPAVRKTSVIVGNNYTQYALDYAAGERGKNFTVQLVDANGKAIANKVVLIGYNGKTLTRITDANGYARVQINLRDQNRLTFAVTFLGDDKYEATMSVYLITIKQKPVTISAAAKTFKASQKTKKYTVTLKTIVGDSADGKTYFGAGKKVTLTLNGKTYSGKVSASGKVTFSINLIKKGKYSATVKFAGDTTYKAASKKVTITIK